MIYVQMCGEVSMAVNLMDSLCLITALLKGNGWADIVTSHFHPTESGTLLHLKNKAPDGLTVLENCEIQNGLLLLSIQDVNMKVT